MIKTFKLDETDNEINNFIESVGNPKILSVNPIILEYDLPKKKNPNSMVNMTGEELNKKYPEQYFPNSSPREKWLNSPGTSEGTLSSLTNRDEICMQNIMFGFCGICGLAVLIYYLSLHYRL